MGHILPFVPRVLRGYPATVAALEPSERLFLGQVRLWVQAVRQGLNPVPALRQAMAAQGVGAAAMSIDMLMRILGRAARRPVEVRCPACSRLAADEQALLHAARLAQGRDMRLAEETLRAALLSPVAASFAMGPLEGLGRIFAAAGLPLPSRALPAGSAAPADSVTPWLPALPATLH